MSNQKINYKIGDRIFNDELVKAVSETEILKQQTKFNNGSVIFWNVHTYKNKYYLLINERGLYEMTEIQFQKFWDMS